MMSSLRYRLNFMNILLVSLRTHCRRPSKAFTSNTQTYTAASVNVSMIASSHSGTSWLSAHDTTLYATSGDARSTARSFVL